MLTHLWTWRMLNEYRQGFIDSLKPEEDVELEQVRFEHEKGLSVNLDEVDGVNYPDG